MEFISTLCGVLCFLCILAAPITLLIWLILLIKKSEKKKKAKYFFLGTLGGIVLFTIIGVATFEQCEHNWETVVKTAATCTENGSTAKICTLCDSEEVGEEIPATGHTWTETVKDATCTEQGERTKKCSVCGEVTTETIDAHHNYTETVVSEPKCESEGKAQLVCSVCGSKEDKAIAATGHTWVNATCTTAKTCSVCNATEGEPIGHTTDAGVCSRCNETVMKQSPVTVVGMRYTIDYVGGVEWTFKIRNNSDKEIKYITFQWSCYNAVGDSIRDEISGKSYVRIKFTGPLAPGETTGSKRNTTLFYNHAYANMKWNEITVEYMDGTTESITEYYEGYYQQ